MPRIPLTISDYTKDNSKATEENNLNDQRRSMLNMMRWPSGSLPGIIDYNLGPALDPYLKLTITNIQERVVTVRHAAQQALRATRGYARHMLDDEQGGCAFY